MTLFKIKLFLIALFSCLTATQGQEIDVFRTIYFPANPAGGIQELKEFVRQEIIYPEELISSKSQGSVFITYLIDSEGHVSYKKIADSGHVDLRKEAERIFDKIVWEADNNRHDRNLGYEMIKFNFNVNKYKKIVKKRGYNTLPSSGYDVDSSTIPLTINDLDKQPKIINGSSINDFVTANFHYPAIAYRMNISGRVTVEFIIEPYGLTSNVRVIEPLAGGCNEETVRLVKSMRWTPGIKNEKAVRTRYKYQLNFVHPGGTVR